MDAAVAGLLGALIGAGAGAGGQIATAWFTSRSDRRRLAIETGMREWERLMDLATETSGAGGAAQVFPAAYFVHFNDELIRLIDKGSLTAENYSDLVKRVERMRSVIVAQSQQRR